MMKLLIILKIGVNYQINNNMMYANLPSINAYFLNMNINYYIPMMLNNKNNSLSQIPNI